MKVKKAKKATLLVPTIRRLPLYLSFLESVKRQDKKYVSAPHIARALHLDPTQITKDFSCINIKGKPKIGYQINKSIEIIEAFLGYHETKKALIIGIGDLGAALIKYDGFRRQGLKIIAGFDIDPRKTGMVINDVKVFHTDKFIKCYKKTPAEIGIIAVPMSQAQKVADIMIRCNIKAIWNFSATPISVPAQIIVENTSIDSGLAMIRWKLNEDKPLVYKNRILQ